MSDGQTKRGPGGNAVGIDGPEFHARSSCAYPYATPCRFCVPDDEWQQALDLRAYADEIEGEAAM